MHIRSKKRVHLREPVKVYDLSVNGTPNFVIGPGVLVHNSKDISDAVVASVKAINDNIEYADGISKKYSVEQQIKLLKSMTTTDNIRDQVLSSFKF